jgi:hypothetical protein
MLVSIGIHKELAMPDEKKATQCSFCHKDKSKVETLVAGKDPNGVPVAVCNECAEAVLDVTIDVSDPTITPPKPN